MGANKCVVYFSGLTMRNLDFKNQASFVLQFNFLWDSKFSYKINTLPSLGIQRESKQEDPECKNAEYSLAETFSFPKYVPKKCKFVTFPAF